MGWISKLLGRQETGREEPKQVLLSLPTRAPHLELLSKFLHAAAPEEVALPYWAGALGEPVGTVVHRFRQAGFLVDASVVDKLEGGFRAPELKALLKQRGLKVSGKKDILIQRLMEDDAPGMQIATSHLSLWICSPEAEVVARAYKDGKDARETTAHTKAFNALKEGRITDAVQSIIEFERTQVFARGVGIDWHSAAAPKQMEAQAKSIMKCSPSILKDVPGDELPMFRAIAAMQALTGESRSKAWLPEGLKGHPSLDLETTVRMIVFAGSHQERLKQMRSSGIKEVTIDHLGTDSCEACQSFGEQKYALADAPELPHPACTNERGCRCGYRPMMPWDDE